MSRGQLSGSASVGLAVSHVATSRSVWDFILIVPSFLPRDIRVDISSAVDGGMACSNESHWEMRYTGRRTRDI
jgi:hypothetical protein